MPVDKKKQGFNILFATITVQKIEYLIKDWVLQHYGKNAWGKLKCWIKKSLPLILICQNSNEPLHTFAP